MYPYRAVDKEGLPLELWRSGTRSISIARQIDVLDKIHIIWIGLIVPGPTVPAVVEVNDHDIHPVGNSRSAKKFFFFVSGTDPLIGNDSELKKVLWCSDFKTGRVEDQVEKETQRMPGQNFGPEIRGYSVDDVLLGLGANPLEHVKAAVFLHGDHFRCIHFCSDKNLGVYSRCLYSASLRGSWPEARGNTRHHI